MHQRCPWPRNDLATAYHDQEWGVPQHDDRVLFEFLILEGAQAGLSWDTILKKRERYREVFDHFDAAAIARYTPAKVEKLLADPGIIRNRAKIAAAIANARAFLNVVEQEGSFDQYIWRFVDGAPRINRFSKPAQVPAETDQSKAMSKDLKKRGFTFVGSTICYAYMQAVGMVNDHLTTCYRHAELSR
jgi:DNA-3-methyladenine glycosylase I